MKWFTGVIASFLLAISALGTAAADTSNFVINDFTANAVLSRADPQGTLQVTEDIKLTYNDFNHGILRAIPERYKSHSLQLHINSVSSPSGAPTEYTTYTSGGNKVLKIGDPDRTITGQQEYIITYTLQNVITFYDNHDELYWDVNGDQWDQQFEKVSVHLTVPTDAKITQGPVCFTGGFGSTNHDCTISSTGNTTDITTIVPLTGHQTLSYVVGFEKGYFTAPTWLDTASEYTVVAAKFLVPFLLLSTTSFLWWWSRGRDAKGRGVIVPQYDAPQGMKALEVGTVYDFDVQNKDITATIIDLAIRHYIKITETKVKKTLQKDTTEYSLQLLNADFSALNPNEQQILKGLFDDSPVGTTVEINKLKNKLYTTATKVGKQVEKDLTDQGYFRSNPKSAGKLLSGIAVVVGIILFYAFGVIGLPGGIGLGLGLVVLFIFAHAMPARTPKGVETLEHIKGLKMYMEVAEKDRIEKLQSPNAPYAAHSPEPTKTVELFEKLLPFAIVLGVEKQWGEQFKSLYTTPPDWYSGNWTTFNALYLTNSLNQGFNSVVNTAFTAPSSSGSSGFGGGGFSGGGGGGGGGGGW